MRQTPVGNGRLLVNHDLRGNVKDIFYPHVGKENHSQYTHSPLLIKIGNELTEFGSEGWEIDIDYRDVSLIAEISGKYRDLEVKISAAVHPEIDLFVREITANKDVELHWRIDLDINTHNFGNTVFYGPREKSLFYYKDNVWFLFSGKSPDSQGIENYLIKDEVTFVRQGNVNTTPKLAVRAGDTASFYLVAGNSYEDVRKKHAEIKKMGLEEAFEKSVYTCDIVSGQCRHDFKDLSPETEKLYMRSIMILLSNVNHNGAISAGNDSSNIHINQDTYQYLWPRDGAYVAEALDDAGYTEYAHKFFEFGKKHLVPIEDGWIWHKYNLDGTYSSTWHSFIDKYDGDFQRPIQQDEIAMMVWSFAEHREHCTDSEEKSLYTDWIKKFADFLVTYRDENGLPKASYDLWEEDYGVFSYTCATVYAGLMAAAELEEEFDGPDAQKYETAAQEVKAATEKHLWSQEKDRFLRDIEYHGKERVEDSTLDASLFALWFYGMFSCSEEKIEKTMTQLKEKLWVKDGIGGLQRYREDMYHTKPGQPANPWIITTLWVAYWHIMRGEKVEAKELIDWVVGKTPKSGVMPEQFDAITGEPLSVGPLTWSHATFIDVINKYLETF